MIYNNTKVFFTPIQLSKQGLCYLPDPIKTEADNTNRGLDNSCYHAKNKSSNCVVAAASTTAAATARCCCYCCRRCCCYHCCCCCYLTNERHNDIFYWAAPDVVTLPAEKKYSLKFWQLIFFFMVEHGAQEGRL